MGVNMKEIFLHKEDIPKNCVDCSFNWEEYWTMKDYCSITGDEVDCVNENKNRPQNCPLVVLEDYKK